VTSQSKQRGKKLSKRGGYLQLFKEEGKYLEFYIVFFFLNGCTNGGIHFLLMVLLKKEVETIFF
jgi:hypothetical protein